MVAGIPVVRWIGRNSSGGEQEYDMAPSLDCAILKRSDTFFNTWSIPTFTIRGEALSVKYGNPDPTVFDRPEGYKVEVENEPGPQSLVGLLGLR